MALNKLENKAQGLGGRIRRLEEKVELLWGALTKMGWEDSITVRETAEGSFCIGGGGADAELQNYAFMAEARFDNKPLGTIVEVKMLGGTVQGLFGSIEPIKTTFWTTESNLTLFPEPEAETDGEEEEGETYKVKKNQDLAVGEYFWLKYDPEEDEYDTETGEGGRWSVEHGTKLPQSATSPDDDQVNYFTVVPLFYLSRMAQFNVVQQHYGAVYVPTVTNIVQVQEQKEEEQAGEGAGSGAGNE